MNAKVREMMTSNYPWLPLSEIAKYESEMRRLKVSAVARSPRGFLTAYKRKSRIWAFAWETRRANFIARHLAQYKKKPTYRRWLSLVAWAYRPDRRFG